MRKFERSLVREIVPLMLECFDLDKRASDAHDLGRSEDSIFYMLQSDMKSTQAQNLCDKVSGLQKYCVDLAIRIEEFRRAKRLVEARKRLSEGA